MVEGLLGFTIDCYISMKIINNWPLRNELNILAADPSVLANSDSLYYSFYRYHYKTSIMLFYYRLTLLVKDDFYEDSW
jgi:hypothetical protein